jgi:LmbE family N-acetylglucosaminyl deacetylase
VRLGTLLGIWAHPDDEAYLSAGLMAQARDAGERVVVVTATRGEHGTPDPHRSPPETLGPLRERELRDALAVLDVHEHHQLGLADGHLDRHDWAMASAVIGHLVHQVRPDTIVTFGPDGITGHPDHQAVSAWATQAWRLAAPTARLLYATATEADDVDRELGVYEDGYPILTAPSDVALEIVLTDDLLARKRAALAAHASQTAPLVEALGEDRYLSWISYEAFRLHRSARSSRGDRRLRRARSRARAHPDCAGTRR